MKLDLDDPYIRSIMGLLGVAIYILIVVRLHRVFVRKLPIRSEWIFFGRGKPLTKFAFCA